MKLRYYTDKKGNKTYTLKDKVNNQPAQEAHYKFIKFKDILE